MRFLACGAFVGGVACGDVDPVTMLSVTGVERMAVVGSEQRYRFAVNNSNPQYALDAITLRVDAMRRMPGTAPYPVQTLNTSCRRIAPRGFAGVVFSVYPPPLRPGEEEAGIVVTPVSALYVVVPRSL